MAQADTGHGPDAGCLVLVVGPSGAGKDTLIEAACERFSGDRRFCFPRRFITRAADLYEHHVPVSAVEFEGMAREGRFLLHWTAHGLSYGIPVEVAGRLNSGATVVANVSRTVVGESLDRFPRVRVINVTADPATLTTRLAARGRESAEGIASRIARAGWTGMPQWGVCDEVRNDGMLEDAVGRFTDLLESYAPSGMRV